eukprot:scaffold7_cov414-Pavlova_lutheri.AAC.14
MSDAPPPNRGDVNFSIQLKDGAKPVHGSPYRLSPQQADEMRRLITKYVETGFVRPSRGSWGSPAILVPKKRMGEYRVVFDFRKLNDVTIPDIHPLPRIDDLLIQLAKAKHSGFFDFRDGFYAIRVAESSRPYTRVITPFGAYDEHLDIIAQFFGLCRSPCFRLKASKCHLIQQEIDFLGYHVAAGEVRPQERLVEAIRAATIPSNKFELRAYLALVGFYRDFIPNEQLLAAVSYDLTGNVSFEWNEIHTKAFEALRQPLLQVPGQAVVLFRYDRGTRVMTDASDFAV